MARLQDVILLGLAVDRPLAPDVAAGTLYYSTDTFVLERSDNVIWEAYGAGSGSVAAHAANHAFGGIDPVSILTLAGYSGIATQFLNGIGAFSAPILAAHAANHSSSGSDPVSVLALAGYPGGTSLFLRADNTFAAPPAFVLTTQQKTRVINFIFNNGSLDLVAGTATIPISCPYTGTITQIRLLSPQTGAIVLDVWKDIYTNYPPVVGDSIVGAGTKPVLSGTNKYNDTALTSYNTAVTAGDVFIANVDSCTGIRACSLQLTLVVT